MIPPKQNVALIYFSVDLVAGIDFVRKLATNLAPKARVEAVSSIYKRFLNTRREDLNSELCVVVKVSTLLPFNELGAYLDSQQVERGVNGSSVNAHASLLSFNNQVLLTPKRPLPHPQLHSDMLTMRCAAEIYGNYEHPVLGQTLNELVKSNETPESIEFFSQGRSLLGDLS